jgi:hypothetical protein
VNNLSKDNEVLQLSNQDLKYSFMFLLKEHKVLQSKLEVAEAKLQQQYKLEQRLIAVTQERDLAFERGLDLHGRIVDMHRLIEVASEQ